MFGSPAHIDVYHSFSELIDVIEGVHNCWGIVNTAELPSPPIAFNDGGDTIGVQLCQHDDILDVLV